MSFTITDKLNDIVGLMRSSLVPHVYDTEVPDDSQLSYTNGIMDPYYIVMIGGPVTVSADRGITGVRDDITAMYCTVSCVAPDSTGRNYLVDSALDLLLGYKPVDSGEMILDGGLTYTNAYTDVRPVKYYKNLSFSFRSNLTRGS